MIRFLYNLVFPFVFLCLLPSFLKRMLRRGKYQHKFGQRMGFYSKQVSCRFQNHSWIWIHAVSVGEVLIALKLIRVLRESNPQQHIALSTTTSTGFALACEQQSEFLEVIYHPIDFLWMVRRVVKMIQPRQLILVEAEVWPNLTAEVKRLGASVVLVNARLSPRSEWRYRRFRFITSSLFRQLDAICVPESEDVSRWESLGVHTSKLHVTGSIKFDHAQESLPIPHDFWSLLQQIHVAPSTPILLGGSTHPGEEMLLAGITNQLRRTHPNLLLILAPRHIERTPTLRHELTNAGYVVDLRSKLSSLHKTPDILLIDTTGELRDWYACATIVFIGKSLTAAATGGQNPAEAIAAGKPVLFGPHMANFAPLVKALIKAQGAITVKNTADLELQIQDLLNDPIKRNRLAAAGQEILKQHHGATQRTISILHQLHSF